MAGKKAPKTIGGDTSSKQATDSRSRKQQARERATALRAEQKRRERRRSLAIQGGVVAVAALIVIGTTIAILQQKDQQAAGERPPAGFSADGTIFAGSSSAPVTVTLIEDFACPRCKEFEATNKELFDTYVGGDDVRLEYRPIAFLDRVSTDEYSSRALNAAACAVADDPDNWTSIHQLLYDNQPAEGGPGLSDEELTTLATQAGADEPAARSCIKDRAHDGWGGATTSRTTSESYFSGTPTVLVDGSKIDDVSATGIQAAVDAAKNK